MPMPSCATQQIAAMARGNAFQPREGMYPYMEAETGHVSMVQYSRSLRGMIAIFDFKGPTWERMDTEVGDQVGLFEVE
jgi:hypothetical protein